jgi:hypothetical protein
MPGRSDSEKSSGVKIQSDFEGNLPISGQRAATAALPNSSSSRRLTLASPEECLQAEVLVVSK